MLLTTLLTIGNNRNMDLGLLKFLSFPKKYPLPALVIKKG